MTNKQIQGLLAETLWIEIEKAILQSPGVRQSYKKFQDFDPAGPGKYHLSLDIKKLGELLKKDEKNRQSFYVETRISKQTL